MRKILFSLVAFLMSATSMQAQTDLVAALSHGNTDPYLFYGEDALKQAYEAASDGDVINLSSGTFNAVDIEKSILLRGVGAWNNTVDGIEPTVIKGNMAYLIPEEITGRTPRLEGIFFKNELGIGGHGVSKSRMEMIKCRFNLQVTVAGTIVTATDCVFYATLCSKCFRLDLAWGEGLSSKVVCLNSFVRAPYIENPNDVSASGSIDMTNCITTAQTEMKLTNSIIISSAYDYVLPSGLTLENCIVAGNTKAGDYNRNYAKEIPFVEGWEHVFQVVGADENSFMAAPGQLFKLTDEAAATYLGTDGMQVGMYGGTAPFNPTPTNPQVKKFSIKGQNDNGKLSVKILVE